MELNNQVLILQAFKMELTVRSFLVILGAIQVKLVNKILVKIKKTKTLKLILLVKKVVVEVIINI